MSGTGTHVENEAKFISFDSASYPEIKKGIMEYFGSNGWKAKTHHDFYYDSLDMELPDGASVRKRIRPDGTCKYTIKIPQGSDKETLSRTEIQVLGTDGSFEELKQFTQTVFPDIEIDEFPVVEITIDGLKKNTDDGLELCLDLCTYDTGDQMIEFEIESLGEEKEAVSLDPAILQFLRGLGLESSFKTKYQRGLEFGSD